MSSEVLFAQSVGPNFLSWRTQWKESRTFLWSQMPCITMVRGTSDRPQQNAPAYAQITVVMDLVLENSNLKP